MLAGLSFSPGLFFGERLGFGLLRIALIFALAALAVSRLLLTVFIFALAALVVGRLLLTALVLAFTTLVAVGLLLAAVVFAVAAIIFVCLLLAVLVFAAAALVVGLLFFLLLLQQLFQFLFVVDGVWHSRGLGQGLVVSRDGILIAPQLFQGVAAVVVTLRRVAGIEIV